jgi:nucleoside-diphosphate-sugar epimerase
VRDLAEAHLKALTTPEAANQRFLIGGAQRFTHTMAVHVIAQIPEIAERVPKDSGEEPVLLKAETEETDRILGMEYRSKEKTFLDTAKKILELEKQLGVS